MGSADDRFQYFKLCRFLGKFIQSNLCNVYRLMLRSEMFSTTESMNLVPDLDIDLKFVFEANLGRAGIASRCYDTRCRDDNNFQELVIVIEIIIW